MGLIGLGWMSEFSSIESNPIPEGIDLNPLHCRNTPIRHKEEEEEEEVELVKWNET